MAAGEPRYSISRIRPTTCYTERDMYHHIKQLMYTVRIGTPDPRFGNMLLEQFGGANGDHR